MDEQERSHHQYLNNLVGRLEQIGELKQNISSIITEPHWYETREEHTLCDLILLYRDFSACAIELKGSPKRRSKAISQIKAGKEYIQRILRYDFKYGIFVVYTQRGYLHERINI